MSCKVIVDFCPFSSKVIVILSCKVIVDKCRNPRHIVDNSASGHLREQVQAASDWRRTVLQRHALSVDLKAGIGVLRMDNRERMGEHSLEIVQAIVMVSKLLFEPCPGDELRLFLFDPV